MKALADRLALVAVLCVFIVSAYLLVTLRRLLYVLNGGCL